MSTCGDNLKRIRTERNLNQTELSIKSGVSRTVINLLERGKRSVTTTETLNKLSKALDVPMSSLLEEEKKAPDGTEQQPEQ